MINRNKKTVATIHLAATNLGDVAWQSHTSRLKYTAENLQTGRMGVFNRGRNFSIRVVVPFRWEQVR
jgi:iron complex outermembrane receptor protein